MTWLGYLRRSGLALAALLGTLSGCTTSSPSGCPEGSDGVEVSDAEGLAEAASEAKEGSCIALAPGSYPAVKLRGGVSLVGSSLDEVTIEGVTLGEGDGAVVRNLTVGAGGVALDVATGVTLESMRIVGSTDAAIWVSRGSSMTTKALEIRDFGQFGIVIDQGTDVTVQDTSIVGGQGPGIWAQCEAGCSCTAPPKVTIQATTIDQVRLVGMALLGAEATLNDVRILETKAGDQWHSLEGGLGLWAAECSTMMGAGMHIEQSASVGVLIDDASGQLGSAGDATAVKVSGNRIGVWIQHLSGAKSLLLENAEIDSNHGVGVGVSDGSKGFIFCSSTISNTQNATLPVLDNGMPAQQAVGDGLTWMGQSQADITGVTLSGNARASILINGTATGSLDNITLTGGDEQKGIVQQNFTMGDQPTIGANTPQVQTQQGQLFAVPQSPENLSTEL